MIWELPVTVFIAGVFYVIQAEQKTEASKSSNDKEQIDHLNRQLDELKDSLKENQKRTDVLMLKSGFKV